MDAHGVADVTRTLIVSRGGPQETFVEFTSVVTATVLGEPIRFQADIILIPVLPSSIDTHAVARFIEELVIERKIRQRGIGVGIVANRAKTKTTTSRR